jgi:phage terminase large subunit
MNVWDDNLLSSPQKPDYNLYGNQIMFRGLDDSSEGYPSDIIFINEALENQNKEKVDGLDMRCRKLMVMDWNPKYTQHWCFGLEGQPNVHFTHSTYKNNKHLEQSVINKIQSYDPSIPINVTNGTADEYRHKVYGLGVRSAPEGLIFKYVSYIDSFPDIGFSYGLDFGFTTDPTALLKHAEDDNNIWLELLLYEPTENADLIHEFAIANNIDIYIPTTADSSDKYTGENKGTVEMVRDLKLKGWNISKVSKTKSIMYWLTSMKKKKIHIVKNHLYHHAKKEQENYRMKLINGIAINQPIDKFNHFWDGAKYAHIAYNSEVLLPPIIYT